MNPESLHRPYSTRRTLLRTAGVAAVAAPLLSACVTAADDDPPAATGGGTKSAENPLGVKPDAPLEIVVFKGGYGDEYAIKAEQKYTEMYPSAKIDHKGLQKVG